MMPDGADFSFLSLGPAIASQGVWHCGTYHEMLHADGLSEHCADPASRG